MRHSLLALTVGLSITCLSAQAQTIHRVNNNPGVLVTGNVYTDLVSANSQAIDGDVVILEPSGQNYGSSPIDRSLVIYGPGYLLGQSLTPPADTRSASVDNLFIDVASDLPVTIEGVVFTGFVYVSSSNVTFRGCLFMNPILLSNTGTVIQNTRFERCIFNTEGTQNIRVDNSALTANVVIQNSLFANGISNYNGSNPNDNTGWIIEYCQFYSQNSVSIDLSNAIFRNNMLLNTASSYNFSGNVLTSNNISYDASLPNVNGNQQIPSTIPLYQTSNTVAVDPSLNAAFTAPPGFTYESQWNLVPGSPAATAGPGGTLIGLYGGSNPYKLNGRPSYPEIFQLNVAPAASATVPLNVTIGVRSNQ